MTGAKSVGDEAALVSALYSIKHCSIFMARKCYAWFKPGLNEPQLPDERSVTLVSSTVVERRRCALQVSSVARLQENKET